MKINQLCAMIAVAVLCLPMYAIVPRTEKVTNYVRVTNVERTDSSLRVGIRMQHRPHSWVRIPSTTRLIAVDDTTLQYKITGAENLSLDSLTWMPESGYHDGTLIFEKVSERVKVVDMVESDQADVKNNILGIHLDEPETRVAPKMITVADIMTSGEKPAENWTGLDPEKYADATFYNKDGKTHLKGRITDYSPRCGFKTFYIRTNNNFKGEDKVNVGNINPDGSFELDIPVTYPQFNYLELGNTVKDLMLIPGDTLSIVTCLSTRVDPTMGYVAEYMGYEGDIDDGVVINILADSLINERYGLNRLFSEYAVAQTDSMAAETYKSNERLGALLDSVVADLPMLLGEMPVSTFAKDVLSAYAISEICEMMESLGMNFRFAQMSKSKNDGAGNSETLDVAKFISPLLKHKNLIYNNPLLMCGDQILLNRWEFNDVFIRSKFATRGIVPIPVPGYPGAYMNTDDISGCYVTEDNYLDSIGVGNCFVAQLVRTKTFISDLNTIEIPSSKNIERNNRLISKLIRHNDCEIMNDIVMEEYTGFVKDVMIAENAIGQNNDSAVIIEDSADSEVLEKIIAPYKGNVLFLDFWGIGCGPCRAGMIRQKAILEELADKPFKALYIANADDGLDACKKWLRKEEIKGEHIFVSGDDWNRLRGLFNFSGIPHGVLVGKDGKVIDGNYDIHSNESKLNNALKE